MTWQEFVSALDDVRAEIRHTKNLKGQVEYNEMKEMFDGLWQVLVKPAPVDVSAEMSSVLEIPADLAACVPDEEPADLVVERGEGEGRMVVERRKTPLVVRPPELIEVTEKELA